MRVRVRAMMALTMLVAALGWGLLAKEHFSGTTSLGQAAAAPQCVLPKQAFRGVELALACVAPNQLLNSNLGEVNDVRINLQVATQKLAEVVTNTQAKARELSELESRRQKLAADVALLNEQMHARCVALARLPAPAAQIQPLPPSAECL